MAADNDSLDQIWTQVYPDLDITEGAPEKSYRPQKATFNEDSTLTVGYAVPKVGETLPTDHEFAPQIDRQFELKDKIGEGGMGQVFRAYQSNLTRDVAIKVFQPGQSRSGNAQQFLAEARVTAWLDHPNIVPAHSLQEFPSGEIQLAMKLIGGESWADQLNRLRPWEKEEVPSEQLEILFQVCNAVAFAHSKNIAHLDLKPDNIMVGEFGEVLVLDWGLAIDFSESPNSTDVRRVPHKSTLTHPCGTPSYMAPELALGTGLDIGPWTDCYLLGGILIKILTGQSPNRASTLIKTLKNAAKGLTCELPGWIPSELRTIIEKSQSQKPEDRYHSVDDFQAELRSFLTHRQSVLLSEEAEKTLRLAEKEDISNDERYRLYGDAAAGFEQALKLWNESPSAHKGSDASTVGALKHALNMGDLGLARSQLGRLSENHPEATALGEQVAEAERDLAEKADLAERQRKRLRWALIALFVGLVIGIISITVSELIALNALADAELANEKKEEALKDLKTAKEKTEEALEDSKAKLAQSYLMAGRFYLESKEHLKAKVLLTASLQLKESPQTRERLLQAHLAQIEGWSQLIELPNQRPRMIIESNENSVLTAYQNYDPTSFRELDVILRVHELSKANSTHSDSPWQSYEITVPKDSLSKRLPCFSSQKPGHVYIPNKNEWQLWNYKTGQLIADAKEPQRSKPSPNEISVQYYYDSNLQRVHYQVKGKKAQQFQAPSPIQRFETSASERFLAFGNKDSVTVIDVLGDNKPTTIPFPKSLNRSMLERLRVSHDGRYIATLFRSEFRIMVWDTKTQSLVYRFDLSAATRIFKFSRNKSVLYVAARNGFHVRRFGGSTLKKVHRLGQVSKLAPAAESDCIYAHGESWQKLNLKESALQKLNHPSEDLYQIIDHPKRNRRLLRYAKKLLVWDTLANRQVAELDLSTKNVKNEIEKVLQPNAELKQRISQSMTYFSLVRGKCYFDLKSPIIVLFISKLILFYNYEKQKVTACIPLRSTPYLHSLSPSGNHLVTVHKIKRASKSARVELWDAKRGQLIREWTLKSRAVSLRFGPNSKHLYATTEASSGVEIWDLKGKVLKVLNHPERRGMVGQFLFSESGRFLLALDNYGYVWIWDLSIAAIVAKLKAHEDRFSMTLTHDGKYLVTNSYEEETVKSWDFQQIVRLLTAPGEELLKQVQSESNFDLNKVLKRKP